MVSLKGEAPGRGPAAEGFRDSVHLPVNTSDSSASPQNLQVSLIRRHFGLSRFAAQIVAEHCFSGRAT